MSTNYKYVPLLEKYKRKKLEEYAFNISFSFTAITSMKLTNHNNLSNNEIVPKYKCFQKVLLSMFISQVLSVK